MTFYPFFFLVINQKSSFATNKITASQTFCIVSQSIFKLWYTHTFIKCYSKLTLASQSGQLFFFQQMFLNNLQRIL